MNNKISERYQKALVTVAMGFRSEDDIKRNGLYRFTKREKQTLIDYVSTLFNKHNSVLALKIKQKGYRSEHININSEEDLNEFFRNINSIFSEDNEIWIVSSSVIECWRCRIYLSNEDINDRIEMAYSYDDHILDHINLDSKVPYVYYEKENGNFKVLNSNISPQKLEEAYLIIKDIFSKYFISFQKIKKDLNFINVKGISLDIRVNNGYDFHDFDVADEDVKKIVEYYLPNLNVTKKS